MSSEDSKKRGRTTTQVTSGEGSGGESDNETILGRLAEIAEAVRIIKEQLAPDKPFTKKDVDALVVRVGNLDQWVKALKVILGQLNPLPGIGRLNELTEAIQRSVANLPSPLTRKDLQELVSGIEDINGWVKDARAALDNILTMPSGAQVSDSISDLKLAVEGIDAIRVAAQSIDVSTRKIGEPLDKDDLKALEEGVRDIKRALEGLRQPLTREDLEGLVTGIENLGAWVAGAETALANLGVMPSATQIDAIITLLDGEDGLLKAVKDVNDAVARLGKPLVKADLTTLETDLGVIKRAVENIGTLPSTETLKGLADKLTAIRDAIDSVQLKIEGLGKPLSNDALQVLRDVNSSLSGLRTPLSELHPFSSTDLADFLQKIREHFKLSADDDFLEKFSDTLSNALRAHGKHGEPFTTLTIALGSADSLDPKKLKTRE